MPASEFNNGMYVRVYEARRGGLNSVGNVARALDVSSQTIQRWLQKDPYFQEAWDKGWRARGVSEDSFTFTEYVYQQLSPPCRAVWDEINACTQDPNGYARRAALVNGCGKTVQQHLYLYALCESLFNPSKALKTLGLSKARLDKWVSDDPDFAKLVDEIHWHKKNFYESKFNQAVNDGELPAVLHAAKTILSDRGFGDKRKVEISGTIQHNVTVLDVAQLDLPLDVMTQLLGAWRAKAVAVDVPRLPGMVAGGTSGHPDEEAIIEGEILRDDDDDDIENNPDEGEEFDWEE